MRTDSARNLSLLLVGLLAMACEQATPRPACNADDGGAPGRGASTRDAQGVALYCAYGIVVGGFRPCPIDLPNRIEIAGLNGQPMQVCSNRQSPLPSPICAELGLACGGDSGLQSSNGWQRVNLDARLTGALFLHAVRGDRTIGFFTQDGFLASVDRLGQWQSSWTIEGQYLVDVAPTAPLQQGPRAYTALFRASPSGALSAAFWNSSAAQNNQSIISIPQGAAEVIAGNIADCRLARGNGSTTAEVFDADFSVSPRTQLDLSNGIDTADPAMGLRVDKVVMLRSGTTLVVVSYFAEQQIRIFRRGASETQFREVWRASASNVQPSFTLTSALRFTETTQGVDTAIPLLNGQNAGGEQSTLLHSSDDGASFAAELRFPAYRWAADEQRIWFVRDSLLYRMGRAATERPVIDHPGGYLTTGNETVSAVETDGTHVYAATLSGMWQRTIDTSSNQTCRERGVCQSQDLPCRDGTSWTQEGAFGGGFPDCNLGGVQCCFFDRP